MGARIRPACAQPSPITTRPPPRVQPSQSLRVGMRIATLRRAGRWALRAWALAWLARVPEVGGAAAARASLAVAERGRAQALLDLLRASRCRGAAPERRASPAPAEPAPISLPKARRSHARSPERRRRRSSYLVTDDTLVTWLVTPGGDVAVARAPVRRDSLAALVSALRAGLAVDDAETARAWPCAARRVSRGQGAPSSEPSVEGSATPSGRGRARRASRPASLAAAFPQRGEVVVVPTDRSRCSPSPRSRSGVVMRWPAIRNDGRDSLRSVTRGGG